ncbi:MAG TPA: hypothetical protein VEV38_05405 [Candidatus Eremiobacteraceae bacterium]|nr:hypothetical protein [Candidatus Eremiobacteraceae bacterium]
MSLGRTIAAIACSALVLSFAASALAASNIFLHVGDVVKYGLSIGVNVNIAPAPNTTQPPVAVKTNVYGTETITGLRTDSDGSVHAKVDVALNSAGTSGTTIVNRTLLMRIAPDGSVAGEGGEDATTMQYIQALSEASRPYRSRTLYVGEKFSQSMQLPGVVPMTVDTQATVVGEKTYLGYPTYAIQSTGTGNFDTMIEGMHAKGVFDVGGTTYYDQRDRLLIGQAMRSSINAQLSGAQGNHITATTTVSLSLGSYVHGHPTPTPVKRATPGPSPTPTPSPSPSAVATYGPNQYYTPTPPSGTPPVPVPSTYPPR